MIVDIAVLVVLLISAGVAFLRGLIREVLTIAGVVGGLIAAYIGGPQLSPYMRGWIGYDPEAETPQKFLDLVPYPVLADILSYGAIFIVVVIILSIISHMLSEGARSIGLGAVDRSLGVVFGLVRGLLLLGILYLPAYALVQKETRDEWFSGSRTHFYIEKTAGVLSYLLPDGTVQYVEEQSKDAASGALRNVTVLPVKKNGTENAETSNTKGYNQEFRQNMDELFEQGEAPVNPEKPRYNE